MKENNYFIRKAIPWLGLLAGIAIFVAQGQTRINLSTQGRTIDFSKAPSTRPEQTGAVLPSTCVPGELFFSLPAPAGQNLNSCVANNTWAVVGNGSSLNDPGSNGLVVRTGPNTTATLAAPAGPVVGTTDTQTLTNKTIDGVSPVTMAYLDATSSIQSQLNSKQFALALPLSVANGGTGTSTTPSLVAGNNVTITGTWPNQTVSAAVTSSPSFVSDNSIANISALGTKYSVSGLINVLSYAPGVTINDGAVHTIGNAPAGTVFYGVTTLAGIAAISINGATPFSWITGQTSPFAFSASSYNLTNAKTANIDIAWLAIQSALLAGKTYIPAGTYVIGSAGPLPLYIPLNQEGTGVLRTPLTIKGDGEESSVIKAGSDFGLGYPLMSCGDPSGTAANTLGRYAATSGMCSGIMEDIGLWSSAPDVYFPIGTSSINMDGLAWGARLRTKDVEVAGFNHDWTIVGDHSLFIRPRATGGAVGYRWADAQTTLYGDTHFIDMVSGGQSQAAISVSGNATISGTFEGETYLGGAPYKILGEANSCSLPIVNSSIFRHVMAEYTGNALIADDHNYSSGTYTDANKCRGITKTVINDLFVSWSNGNFWGGGRARRAAIDVAGIGLTVGQLECDSGCWAPNQLTAPSGASPVATINVTGSDNIGGVSITGNINNWISISGALPLAAGVPYPYDLFAIRQTGAWSGTIKNWSSAGTYLTTTVGDVFEFDQYGLAPGGTGYISGNSSSVAGVVMQGGLTAASLIPVASSGTLNLNAYWTGFSWAMYRKSTGIRGVTLVGGSGYTNGTYSQTATGGGCTTEPVVSETFSGGTLISYVVTNIGRGCTSAPAIAIAAGAGPGTGASVTTLWPSALAAPASNLTDVPLIGPSVGGGGSGATQFMTIKLQGLQ